jgi:antitoxin (DNA-binding transcriptional repressor) of toxin-antitoxin stability system
LRPQPAFSAASLSGQPVAKLVPVAEAPRRQLGVDRGRITIGADFDAVNPEITALFEGQ